VPGLAAPCAACLRPSLLLTVQRTFKVPGLRYDAPTRPSFKVTEESQSLLGGVN